MKHVALGSAFVWQCPICGLQHFGLPRCADLDGECFDNILDEFVQSDFVVEDADISEDEDSQPEGELLRSPVLISRVSILPRFVTCGGCGGKFMGVAEIDDGDEDDEEPK